MKLFKLVTALAIGSLCLSALIIPATAIPSSAAGQQEGFNISFEEITDGSQRHLQWSHTNCIPVTGETATVTYTMTKDGANIPLNGQTRLQLETNDAGTYHLDAVCNYSQWLAPVKKSMELKVSPLPQSPKPPENKPQDDEPFTLYFDKVGEGVDAKLAWRTTGCRAPSPATLTLTLTRDNTPINIDSLSELTLKDQPAGTYTIRATCSPEWLVPTTLTKSIVVSASQPDQPTPEPESTPDNEMAIDVAEFTESLTGRTLSWNVSGCSVTNRKTVNVSILFNGNKAQLRRSSRTESVNASQWPTGVYTIEAQCRSLDGHKVYSTQSRDITLTRANLPVTFAGEPLNYLIPRPGDRVRISSYPSHQQLLLTDGTKAEPFAPGEDVELFVTFDDSSERTSIGHITANNSGHVDTTIWIPLNEKATSFTIFAVGTTNKYQLDYRSLLTSKPAYGIKVSKADATVRNIRVSSYRNDELSSDNAFTKNSTITIKVLDPSGSVVMSTPATTTNDGSLDTVISLPSGLSDGRYTVIAATPLALRGNYSAYFYLKDNEAWAQWDTTYSTD
ncbi:hypothetical protein [Arcanobacterium phocae]|uniref:hypothetical protein n=1 Tax=Arcanobacterium phocae TaxID=131112 RepID=UPI001C0F0698|nr:hypothetical protein [Arcanobacterium phocae]